MRTTTALALGLLPLLAGCVAPTGPRVSLSYDPMPPRALVLVLDGAASGDRAGLALETVSRECGLGLRVLPYDWSHGWLRYFADQSDTCHLDQQAQDFARYALTVRAENPGKPLHVLTFSAGSGVLSRAARLVPANTFERVVLLAPAVASTEDLRPLLHAARRGVDAFTSNRDGFLRLGRIVIGPTGGARGQAIAGVDGFQPVVADAADAALYSAKLREYPWTPDYRWTGNIGQHNGPHRPQFMATFVAPLFLAP